MLLRLARSGTETASRWYVAFNPGSSLSGRCKLVEIAKNAHLVKIAIPASQTQKFAKVTAKNFFDLIRDIAYNY